MTFTLNSKALLTAINLTAKGINQNNIVPASSCYRLKSVDDKLEVSSCNMEISMQTTIDTDVPGLDVLMPFDRLKLVASLPDQGLLFDISESYEVTVKSMTGVYSFSGYSGDGFQVINTETNTEITLQADDLTEAIYASSYARSTDPLQLRFTGLSVEIFKDKIVFAGCNLLLLSVFNLKGKFKSANLLLSPAIVASLPELNGEVKIKYSTSSISFEYPNLTIKSLLMDEKFPDWRQIVPKNDVLVTFDRAQLQSAIKRVLEFSNKVSGQVALSSTNGVLTITGEDTAYKQRAVESLNIQGGDISIGLNGRYLFEALSHFSSETVELRWQSFDKAIVINEPDETENFAMIMAMVQN